uniref:Uncharacterized protein n=1 Tax=Rhizophora mucronata TaxID=61149 RepID=A0A2P2P9I4_RHIMU
MHKSIDGEGLLVVQLI